jgi:hypothetical protein
MELSAKDESEWPLVSEVPLVRVRERVTNEQDGVMADIVNRVEYKEGRGM